MKRKNVFSILGAAIILSAVSFSCTNNDTTDGTATASMDTTAVTNPDIAPMPKDTMINTTATINNKAGIANPAKKGMKGKVSVVENVATNAGGKMEADKSGIYSNVEIIPSFPGGYKGLQKYFDDNIEYPAEATNEGVEGTVNLTFVVDENGKLTSLKTTGEKIGYGLEEEALRIVNKMPVWNPGKLKGKNVKTSFTLPVTFQLY